jgi:hypothetical protein
MANLSLKEMVSDKLQERSPIGLANIAEMQELHTRVLIAQEGLLQVARVC